MASLASWIFGAAAVAEVAATVADPTASQATAQAAATGATLLAAVGINANKSTFWGQVSSTTGFSPDSIFLGLILFAGLLVFVLRRKG